MAEGYIYDPSWELERARLSSLERENDPYTKMHAERLGIDAGWHVLEIGGGGGSITEWLCARVGDRGRVVATDLDTRFLNLIDAKNVEVRTHDILSDPIEEEAFDLVHSRFLLEHLPEPDRALDAMIAAVRPGGWLLIEDVDFTPLLTPDETSSPPEFSDLIARFFRAASSVMKERGIDPFCGRTLPLRLRGRGLSDLGAAVRRPFMTGGSPESVVAKLSATALRSAISANGAIDEATFDRLLAAFDDPASMGFGPQIVAAWGRKTA